jgi:Ca2+-binding RTX toxin-like protein
MASKLGKSTVWTGGDDSDMFDFYGHLTSSDFSAYDGFFTETIDASEKSYDPPKIETPTSGLFVIGTERDDTLYGSEFNDEIHGLAGNDRIDGGGGNDLLFGGTGGDKLFGGTGVDTVSYANHNASVYVDLVNNLVTSHGAGEAEGEQADEGHGHTIETDSLYSIERIIGSNYGDVFFTNDSAYIEGGGGNDRIYGGTEGLSVLLGGDGDDLLVAGGSTWMTGGSGADEFNLSFNGPSTIADFESGIDKIWGAAGWYQDSLPFGHDGILASGTNVPTVSNADRDSLFYDTDDYSLYEIRYNDDGEATATLMATFTNGVQLQTSDFIFV